MTDKIFLDTNIIGYAFDKDAPEKQKIARKIIDTGRWTVSWQVLQEFANIALTRFKLPLKHQDIADYQDLVLWPNCSIFPDSAIHRMALELREKTQYQFYDCLIIASAITSESTILLSEDMDHGRKIGGLEIRNPFH